MGARGQAAISLSRRAWPSSHLWGTSFFSGRLPVLLGGIEKNGRNALWKL